MRPGAARLPGRKAAGAGLAGLVLLTTLVSQPARAQADTSATAATDSVYAAAVRGAPPAIRWGKWVAAALAAGLTAAGVEQHNNGNAAFRSLIAYCGQVAICTLTPAGRYADATAEARYQRVVRSDRAARAWLVAGQLTAVGTAVLFVADLVRQREPANIPYSGLLVDSRDGVTRVGLRIPVRIGAP